MKNLLFVIIILSYSINVFSQRAKFGDNTPKPLKRLQEFNKIRQSENIDLKKARLDAISQSNQIIINNFKNKELLQSIQTEWYPIGPSKTGGRIRSIAWHPTNTNIIYIGAAAGGIWKSTNKGSSWTPIFDFENAISMGALAIDPNNPSIIYAGTGEMIMGGGNPYLGSGMYKSTDDGANWEYIGLSEVGAFSKIYVHPLNSKIIIAGAAVAAGGLYISENSGQSWTKLYDGNVTDLTINTKNIDEIIIGVNSIGIYYSSDRGKNWTKRSSMQERTAGRISVQGFKDDFNILYTLFERSDSRAAIYKSTNKGNSWTKLFDGDYAFFRGQGFYNNFIEIHPKNKDIALTGGIKLWRTPTGGNDWYPVNEYSQPEEMHVDAHCAVFHPNNNDEVLVGNDGGIYFSNNAGNTWANINNNLQITQFYAMAIDFSVNELNYGGTQDNGSQLVSNNKSGQMIAGGDGFDMFVHPKENRTIFGEFYYGYPFKYTNINGGELQYLDDNLPKNDSGLWHSPFILDEKSNSIYLGLHAVYSSLDFGETWFPLTERYDEQFTSIAVSGVKSNVIYAGNERGRLIYTSNFGSTWTDISSPKFPARYITDIKTSKIEEGTVYVTFGGFDVPKVFKSKDFGKNWTDISKNLPNINVNCVAINPIDEKIVLVGTDIGVFISYNEGNEWFPFGSKLPRTPIMDLVFHKNLIKAPGIVLRAATHGRSMWEIVVPTAIQSISEITSPIGGEFVFESSNMNLSWYGFDFPIKLSYSLDNGNIWTEIARNVASNSFLWKIPNINSEEARIKVESSQTTKISNAFTISPLKKGAPINFASLNMNTYGIAYNGKGGIWITDYYSNRLRLLDADNFEFKKEIRITGDQLFTDISYDKQNDIIYVNRLNNDDGIGSVIVVCDTNGYLIDEIISPARDYPIGLAYSNSYLYVSERDNNQMIYKFLPESPTQNVKFNNPKRDVQYGPRSMTYLNGKLHQVFTDYSSNTLQSATIQILDIDKDQATEAAPLLYNKTINARGIDIDDRDGNYWVNDFNGNIYKIIGDKSITSVENKSNEISVTILPNPASEFLKIFYNDSNNKFLHEIDDILTIEIYNLLGELMLKKITSKKIIEIDVNKFEKGMYLVNIKGSNGASSIVEKFVKE